MDNNFSPISLDDVDTRIKKEQVRLSLRQLPFAIYVPPVSAAILAFLLWGHVDEDIIIGWLIIVVLGCSALSGWVVWHFKITISTLTPKAALTRLTALGLVGGLAWGSGGYVLFTPDSFSYLGLLFLWMYLPAASGAMMSLTCPSLFYANMLGMLAPITIRCIAEGDAFHLTLAFTTIIFMGCLIFFHNHIHKILMDSMRLRFEKGDLLDAVTLGKEVAERANIAKSRFLAAANHDLRQPLHAQTLFVSELKLRTKDPESVRIIEHLESSIDAMSGLFNSLLDISKLDAEMVEYNKTPFSMAILCNELEAQFANTARANGLDFSIVPCAKTILSDRLLLARILQNLVTNAIKYTASGSITVGFREAGELLIIEVRDTGSGIALNRQTEIFDEFVQLDNPERDRNKGLGLGLAIVSRLGQLLGHEISVRSSPGHGSVFSIAVSLCDPSSNVPVEGSIIEANKLDIDGIRILVIDNEPSIRTGTQGLLRKWGCSVMTASGLNEAMQLITEETEPPQVIISDYRLAGDKTGIDTLNQLEQCIPTDTVGILLTGDTATDVLRKADESGYHVLHKPVSLDKLRALVNLATPRNSR